jgi:DNA binding domain, excisionase family
MELAFLTVEEVAKILGISKRTVYNWIDEGIIRAFHVKNKSVVRIPLLEVERILKEVFENDEKVESILKSYEDIIKPKRGKQ